MNKDKHYVGIDISKDTFDVFDSRGHHHQFTNDVKGYKLFIKTITDSSCCVMEATGCYHQRLAMYLFNSNIGVAVLNPVVIKRYTQMKLHHTKTDKSDAKMICSYAQEQPVSLWVPEPDYIIQCNMLQSAAFILNRVQLLRTNSIVWLVVGKEPEFWYDHSIDSLGI